MLPQSAIYRAQTYRPNLKSDIRPQGVMGIVYIHQPDEKIKRIMAKYLKDMGFLFFLAGLILWLSLIHI